ncbi:MAG: hypothetical protein ACLGH2_13635, partial [Gammaproteobacteria bacterium]
RAEPAGAEVWDGQFIAQMIAEEVQNNVATLRADPMSLSEILCVRHTMTIRSMYVQQDEAEERSDCREIGRAAQDPAGVA